MLSIPKLSAGGVAVLFASLLQTLTVEGASVRHHRLRGSDQGGFLSPSTDMIKALEYIESLKQRADGSESPTGDYDEVDKFRFLVQLASLQDENAPQHEDMARWPDNKRVPQWVQSLLRMLEQAGESPASQPSNERRLTHKSRRPVGDAESPVGDYGGFVKPHKKYPLMFEDDENGRDNKRATEDLDEQYTPQSLANMRSIFEELGKLSAAQNKREKQDDEDGEDDDDLYRVRNLAYEDVTGGEDWVPLEEQMETEEVVKGSHEEYERGLADNSEPGEIIERRAGQADEDEENPEDDTKLVDYYLLKVLEMSDQAQKRDLMEGRRRLQPRPSLIDPRAIKQLLSAISVKLQVPPEDLVGMLFMEETRKQQRLPEIPLARKPSQPQYKSRVIKYYNGRQPEVTVSDIPHDVKTEDILKVLGLGNLANKNAKLSLLKQRPYKTAMANYFNPSGRRGSTFLSELNKAPSKRKDDYDDDAVDEDEESTFLAAKLLTEYPDTSSSNRKRAIDSTDGQLPYELYEEAMKDFFDQVDNGKSMPAKRDTQGKEEPEAPQKPPTQEPVDQTPAVSKTEDAKEYYGKMVAGM
ncbi:secretogranin-2-like [Myxocyprinus asiaticus]|uniref:secretogranin-2-like n=1 Tax=Myxocyprinus asiaticus TaxID=70543 RepID=UPI0022226B37|nr:secretogranin-2-like [Myxocyprinus asiaticus]